MHVVGIKYLNYVRSCCSQAKIDLEAMMCEGASVQKWQSYRGLSSKLLILLDSDNLTLCPLYEQFDICMVS